MHGVMVNLTFVQMGIGGAYHSWSPLYPDPGGLLINICDLCLDDGGRIVLNGKFNYNILDWKFGEHNVASSTGLHAPSFYMLHWH